MTIATENQELEIKYFGIKRKKGEFRVCDILDGDSKIFLNDPVQRKAGVWNLDQKSKLINSILRKMYIPSICVQTLPDDIKNIIDGKQRITTAISYAKDEFALSKKAESIEVELMNGTKTFIDIADKKFSQLPRKFQREILTYTFLVVDMEMDDETKNEMFDRLNSGVSLKPIEKAKASMTPEFLDWLKNIKQNPIFTSGFSEGTDIDSPQIEERVLQGALTLIGKGDTGLGKREIEKISKQGITEEQKMLFEEVASYLNKMLDHIPKKKIGLLLQKSKSATLFRIGDIALLKSVDPQVTAEWAFNFFVENWRKGGNSGKYKDCTGSGSARLDNVSKRNQIAADDYKVYVEEYYSPIKEDAM